MKTSRNVLLLRTETIKRTSSLCKVESILKNIVFLNKKIEYVAIHVHPSMTKLFFLFYLEHFSFKVDAVEICLYINICTIQNDSLLLVVCHLQHFDSLICSQIEIFKQYNANLD